MTLDVLDLGRRPFSAVWTLQKATAAKRAKGECPDTLYFVEHEPVYTRGTSGRKGIKPNLPFPVYDIERGGDVTFHGPGQLVGYPIIHLRRRGLLVGAYLRRLEAVLIDALRAVGVSGEAVQGKTGVWVGEKKIASIGVAVKGWVTYHGFSLNVGGDLSPFSAVRPCGFDPSVVASVESLTGRKTSISEMKERVKASFAKFFIQTEEASCIP